jgi:hypothetical protein
MIILTIFILVGPDSPSVIIFQLMIAAVNAIYVLWIIYKIAEVEIPIVLLKYNYFKNVISPVT